jgi:hypothetical protein
MDRTEQTENKDCTNQHKINDLSVFFKKKKGVYDKIINRILRCISGNDYATLETYFNIISDSELKKLLEYNEGMIIEMTYLLKSSKAFNFIAEKIPKEIIRAVIRNNDFYLVRNYLGIIVIVEKNGYTDEHHMQLRNEFIEIFLKIDREGVSELVFKNKKFHNKIADNLTSIKEEVEKILKKMDTINQNEMTK